LENFLFSLTVRRTWRKNCLLETC